MLKEIYCDKFTERCKRIAFEPGLNTVLGSSGGSNAIGKTTLLQIIDYAFGGDDYHKTYVRELNKYVGEHSIYFTFEFDGVMNYFFRNPTDTKEVCRCDKDGHLIKKMPLDEYRLFLQEQYKVDRPGIKFGDICSRFFRYYGRENTLERYPLLIQPREQDEKAVDFLLALFGYNKILVSLKAMEEELGVKASQLRGQKKQPVDTSKIESNQKSIESLEQRLTELMQDSDNAQMGVMGFDEKAYDRANQMRKELQGLVNRRNKLRLQVNALKDRMNLNGYDSQEEFRSLQEFFPGIDMRAFSEIGEFHKNIRKILNSELTAEIDRLEPTIEHCEKEIERLKEKILDSGMAKRMSENVLSQCVQISKSIDRLRAQNDELIRQRELQKNREQAVRRLNQLFNEQSKDLALIVKDINDRMHDLNAFVTEEGETDPVLKISEDKNIDFQTPGNTSEGAAFKSMILYDLSLLQLCPLPALIHDSNILKSLGDLQLEHILELYGESNKQIFIAFDKPDSTTTNANKILNGTTRIQLSKDQPLFGIDWSNLKVATQA